MAEWSMLRSMDVYMHRMARGEPFFTYLYIPGGDQ